MKKKAVIIIIACVVVLAGIVLAYFTLPVSYAGTGASDPFVFDQHKLILPTEAQASRVKSGMTYEEILDIIGLPQKNEGPLFSSGAMWAEFHLRGGHRLWVDGFSDNMVVTHSDYPYQTYKDYTERHKEREDANNEHIADGLNKSETA